MSSSSPTAVITGSTGGIGEHVARGLAAAGWNLVLANRSEPKSLAQRADLADRHPGVEVDVVTMDLMDTADLARGIATIAERHPRIDALHNIAGVLTSTRTLSAQGYESHFAVNVLAPYQLTTGLRPQLRRAPGEPKTMVTTMSSGAVNRVKALDVAGLPHREEIGGLMGAYAESKAAVNVTGRALADEFEADGILLRSVDPGATKTGMLEAGDGIPFLVKLLSPLLFKAPETRSAAILTAADPTTFGGRTGIFLANGKEKRQPAPATDPTTQRALLDLLEASLEPA